LRVSRNFTPQNLLFSRNFVNFEFCFQALDFQEIFQNFDFCFQFCNFQEIFDYFSIFGILGDTQIYNSALSCWNYKRVFWAGESDGQVRPTTWKIYGVLHVVPRWCCTQRCQCCHCHHQDETDHSICWLVPNRIQGSFSLFSRISKFLFWPYELVRLFLYFDQKVTSVVYVDLFTSILNWHLFLVQKFLPKRSK